jgi:hypothetical protein
LGNHGRDGLHRILLECVCLVTDSAAEGAVVRRRLRYVLLLLLTAATLALAGVLYDRSREIRWSGGYLVQVKIERSGTRQVSNVSAAILFRREWESTEGDPARIDSGWHVVPVSGEPFTLQVKCGGKESRLGFRTSSVRQEVLVLKVDYADGSNELVVAHIPESKSRREMGVRVP